MEEASRPGEVEMAVVIKETGSTEPRPLTDLQTPIDRQRLLI
jgi:hypothetical protein